MKVLTVYARPLVREGRDEAQSMTRMIDDSGLRHPAAPATV